jgi:hypothetical protein
MAQKATNAKSFAALLGRAWECTPSFICSNDDYIYCLYPSDDKKQKWIEASITFPDGSLDKKEIDPVKAIALLIEELKVLPDYGVDTVVTTKEKLDEAASRLANLK